MTARSLTRLDAMKLLMAFLVVEIHTRPFRDFGSPVINEIVSGVDCVAVPFFFIASGFLCFRGLSSNVMIAEKADGRIKKTISRLLFLYICWVIIYLPTSVYALNTFSGGLTFKNLCVLLRNVFLVGEGPFSYHLWYLHASIVSYVLLRMLFRLHNSIDKILFWSCLVTGGGYVLQIVRGEDFGLVSQLINIYFFLFSNVRNGLFEGLFYTAVGMFLACRFSEDWFSRNEKKFIAGICIGGFLSIIITPDAHLPFCALYAISTFAFAISRSGERSLRALRCRQLSVGIYLCHMLFAFLFVYVLFSGNNSTLVENEVLHIYLYIFTLICSTALTLFVIVVSRRFPMAGRVFGISAEKPSAFY